MYHCNLARTPAIPFFSRVSRRPPCSKPLTDSHGFHSKTLDDNNNNAAASGIRVFAARSLHQGTPEPDDGAKAATKPLPWIRSRGGREGKGADKKKPPPPPAQRSPWVASAENYISRNGGMPARGDADSRGGTEVREGEGEGGSDEAEPVDDPRWYKIKNKYREFVEREPQFEKPEVQRWNKEESWGREREPRFEKPEVQRWNKQESWGRKTWKEASESSVPKMVGQGVYGVGPVLAALSVARREFYALYVQEGLNLSGNNRKKKDKKGVEKVLQIAEKVGLKVVKSSKHDLNMVVDNRPHQGLVLDASPLEMVNMKELEPPYMEGKKAPLWVALDEVTDPQNLGAIIRSAYFFGAQGVIMCAKNSAPLSGVVSKASAGSLELIELMSCKNMMQFLSLSVENGWRVLGGSVSSRAIPLREVEVGMPTILVLGSEGTGLRPLVERSCTQLIRIPGDIPINGDMGGDEIETQEMEQSYTGQELKTFLAVESLNVSVAAGVLLYHLAGEKSNLVSEKLNTASKVPSVT